MGDGFDGRQGGRIICFGPSEFLLKRHRGGANRILPPTSQAWLLRQLAGTDFARLANLSIDGDALLRYADLFDRRASASPFDATRSSPISATTAKPSSVGCGASCKRSSPNGRSPRRRRRRRRRRPHLAFFQQSTTSVIAQKRDLFIFSSPLASKVSSSSAPTDTLSSMIGAISAADFTNSPLLLTPVAGSPRSIA